MTAGPAGATAPNPSTAQARVISDELARAGVTEAVVCPGSRSTALAVALHEDPRIRMHVHLDERSAAFVALGLARATGRPAVVVVTSGSAVANLHPAVVEADHDGVPLILLTADRPPELRSTGANQTMAQAGLFGPSARWAEDLGVAEDRPDAVRTWRATVARLVAEALGLAGPPGPVQLNVAFREPTVPVSDDGRVAAAPTRAALEGRGAFDPWVAVERAPRIPAPQVLDALAATVAGTERGVVVVAGDAPLDPDAADALAGATGWPLLAEGHAPARGAAATLAAGGWLLTAPDFVAAHRPDVVLRLGRPTVLPAGRLVGAGTEEVLVDPYGRWSDPARTTSRLLVADPTAVVDGLVARLPTSAGSDWLASWRTADRAATAALDVALADGSAPLELSALHRVLDAVPAGVSLLVGSSGPIRDLDLAAAPARSRTFANRGVSGIDGTVSTALGLALGAGPAVAVVGDQTFLHDGGAFLLQPDAPSVDLTVVVIVNGGGALFDRLPAARHAPGFDRLFYAPHGRRIGAVAGAHGVDHLLTTTIDGLGEAVGGRPQGLGVIEVVVDRDAERTRRPRLEEAVRRAIGRSGPPE